MQQKLVEDEAKPLRDWKWKQRHIQMEQDVPVTKSELGNLAALIRHEQTYILSR